MSIRRKNEELPGNRIARYGTSGLGLLRRETGLFLRNSFGSLFSREFMTVFIPILILWEILPRLGLFPRSLVPALSDVLATAWEMVLHKDLLGHVLNSMGKFFLGLSIAVLTAIPIGILMGWNIFIRKHVLPLFQLLAPIPPPAWVPLTIIGLGVGLPMQTFLIFLGAFYPVLFHTYQAIKDTDPRYLASARVFGASELTLILRVYLCHALGAIIMSVKTGITMGLVMLVIAEIYGGRSGIGYLLVEAKDFFQIPAMVVCMIVLGGIGWFLIEIMKFVELKLSVWKVLR